MKGIKLEQYLRIRSRVKAHAEGREFRAQLAVVVDFAVEHDPVPGLSVEHRLRLSLREVDAKIVGHPQTSSIWGTGHHAITNVQQLGLIDKRSFGSILENSGQAAHGSTRFPR